MDSHEIRKRNLTYWAELLGRDKLATKLGYSDTNYLNQLLSGHTKIGPRSSKKFSSALKKEDGWLDQPHQELWSNTDSLSGVKEPVKISSDPSSLSSNTAPGPNIQGYIPLISWVQAGSWQEAVDLYEVGDAEKVLPTTVSHGKGTFALRVDGDSMTAPPGTGISFPSGMVIYVDPTQRGGVVTGDYVVARRTDTYNATFKQLGSEEGVPILKPLNTNGQHPIIRDEFEILGKVIDAGWGGL